MTQDELMTAWKGKKGNGGIPQLLFVERKPIPLGTEAKVVCEGSMACVFSLNCKRAKLLWRGKNDATSTKQLVLVPFVCWTKWERKKWRIRTTLYGTLLHRTTKESWNRMEWKSNSEFKG